MKFQNKDPKPSVQKNCFLWQRYSVSDGKHASQSKESILGRGFDN
jgi:hypothetical protein